MYPERDPGRLSAILLRRIERYRSTSPLAGRGVCRFSPSCSHYAEEQLRTHSMFVALPLILWRVLRCNPFMNRVVEDPVRRPRRRLRPNTLPTLFSIIALSGMVVVVTAAVAEAVGVSGGCTATINGQDPSTMTKKDPLVVHKGETVAVTGTAPAGTPAKDTNNTHIDVAVIDGVFSVSSSDHPGHGPNWGGTQEVDKYLKYGVGLYHVTGVADGSSGWHCEGDGYVQLKDGNPLTKPIGAGAAALVVIGGGGALLAARARPEETAASADVLSPPAAKAEEDDAEFGSPDETVEHRINRKVQAAARGTDGLVSFGCAVLLILAGVIGCAIEGTLFAVASQSAVGDTPRRERIWAHGHPIAGFIFGLLAGIGITVLLQQFAVWPLSVVTAIAFPLVVALLCALRAYLGRPYNVVTEGL